MDEETKEDLEKIQDENPGKTVGILASLALAYEAKAQAAEDKLRELRDQFEDLAEEEGRYADGKGLPNDLAVAEGRAHAYEVALHMVESKLDPRRGTEGTKVGCDCPEGCGTELIACLSSKEAAKHTDNWSADCPQCGIALFFAHTKPELEEKAKIVAESDEHPSDIPGVGRFA